MTVQTVVEWLTTPNYPLTIGLVILGWLLRGWRERKRMDDVADLMRRIYDQSADMKCPIHGPCPICEAQKTMGTADGFTLRDADNETETP